MEVRLNKFISEAGHCSRREADKMIEIGRVRVNGKIPQLGDKISGRDKVTIDGNRINGLPEPIYLAFNKPKGVTCTTDAADRSNIIDYINHPQRIFNIGRLDKDSEGLIFLTNDGDIVNKILRAGNMHEKEYVVTVNQPITDEFITGMSNGVPILGTMTRKCKVEKTLPMQFRITLTQGLNRQIRRMCEYFGYDVVQLVRTRIMNVSLKGLQQGEFRDLTSNELATIMQMVKDSSGTAPEKGTAKKETKSVRKESTNREYALVLAASCKQTKTGNSKCAANRKTSSTSMKAAANKGGGRHAGGSSRGKSNSSGRNSSSKKR
jgi:23S rRNA pseudouridine2604 synthase